MTAGSSDQQKVKHRTWTYLVRATHSHSPCDVLRQGSERASSVIIGTSVSLWRRWRWRSTAAFLQRDHQRDTPSDRLTPQLLQRTLPAASSAAAAAEHILLPCNTDTSHPTTFNVVPERGASEPHCEYELVSAAVFCVSTGTPPGPPSCHEQPCDQWCD